MTLASPRWNVRLGLVCLAAMAVSLPIAWVSLAKLFLALAFLYGMAGRALGRGAEPRWPAQLQFARLLPWLALLVLVSLLWTQANMETALQSAAKHNKLVFMLLPVLLIRNLVEARMALRAFALGQVILLGSSMLAAAGLPPPWVVHDGGKNAAFSSYLDQAVILASSAAVFWHLRGSGIWPRWLALACCVAALVNVVFLLEGRTGYVLVVGLASLAVAWHFPPRWRRHLYGLTAVLLMASVAWAYWYAQQGPASGAGSMDRSFVKSDNTLGSDAWRLNAWQRSLQAVQASPLVGTGTGSWKSAITPFDGASAIVNFGLSPISNPHQEYLLWAVEFGLLGCAALVGLLVLLARDARHFDPPVARALWSLVAACAVAGMFNSVLYDDLIGDFFCICTGLLLALGMHSHNNETTTP